jgi:hypothetical protein
MKEIMIFKGLNMIYIKARILASMNNKHMSIQISSLYSINTVIKGEAMIISLHFINKQFAGINWLSGTGFFSIELTNCCYKNKMGPKKITTHLHGSNIYLLLTREM